MHIRLKSSYDFNNVKHCLVPCSQSLYGAQTILFLAFLITIPSPPWPLLASSTINIKQKPRRQRSCSSSWAPVYVALLPSATRCCYFCQWHWLDLSPGQGITIQSMTPSQNKDNKIHRKLHLLREEQPLESARWFHTFPLSWRRSNLGQRQRSWWRSLFCWERILRREEETIAKNFQICYWLLKSCTNLQVDILRKSWLGSKWNCKLLPLSWKLWRCYDLVDQQRRISNWPRPLIFHFKSAFHPCIDFACPFQFWTLL